MLRERALVSFNSFLGNLNDSIIDTGISRYDDGPIQCPSSLSETPQIPRHYVMERGSHSLASRTAEVTFPSRVERSHSDCNARLDIRQTCILYFSYMLTVCTHTYIYIYVHTYMLTVYTLIYIYIYMLIVCTHVYIYI